MCNSESHARMGFGPIWSRHILITIVVTNASLTSTTTNALATSTSCMLFGHLIRRQLPACYLRYATSLRHFTNSYISKMPAKRIAATKASSTKSAPQIERTESSSSRKRKASSSDAEESEVEASQSQSKSKKKAKVANTSEKDGAEDGGLSANGQPTNKVLPVNINFAPKPADSIRISSWNICGLGASSKKVNTSPLCVFVTFFISDAFV